MYCCKKIEKYYLNIFYINNFEKMTEHMNNIFNEISQYDLTEITKSDKLEGIIPILKIHKHNDIICSIHLFKCHYLQLYMSSNKNNKIIFMFCNAKRNIYNIAPIRIIGFLFNYHINL